MSKERFAMTVIKGGIAPADAFTVERLRERRYTIGDAVTITISKRRSNGFNRLAHQLGALCVENLEGFEELDAHKALKRLQLESGVACEETAIKIPGLGMVLHRLPLSLSFDTMDQGEFYECIRGLARHVAQTYWKTLDENTILQMSEVMP